jgi:hypothetical protein
MEFKWSVEKVTVTTNNIVTHVHWRVEGTQDDMVASYAGIKELILGDTSIPYAQLTETQMLEWCFKPEVSTWTDIDNVEQTSIRLLKDEGEAQVSGQIARQLVKKAAEPALPWIK